MKSKTSTYKLTDSELAVELWAIDLRLSKLETPKETARRRIGNKAEILRNKLIEKGHIEEND